MAEKQYKQQVELKHVGILGMKWGIRKADPRAGGSLRQKFGVAITKTPVVKSKSSGDHTTARGLQKKKLNELSNEELKKLTTRLQLEKQYKDLSKSESSVGSKFVSDVILNAGKQLASKYVANAMESGGQTIIDLLRKRGG